MGERKSYNPFARKPWLGGSQIPVSSFYRTRTSVMDENAQSGEPKDLGCDVPAYGCDIATHWQRRVSPIPRYVSSSECSSDEGVSEQSTLLEFEAEEEPIVPPNPNIYGDLGFHEGVVPEKTPVQKPDTSVEDEGSSMDISDCQAGRTAADGASQDINNSQDVRAAADGCENVERTPPAGCSYFIMHKENQKTPAPNPHIYEAMDVHMPSPPRVVVQQPGTSVEDEGSPMDITDSQDFRGAAEGGENVVDATPKRTDAQGQTAKGRSLNLSCICCANQTGSSTNPGVPTATACEECSKNDDSEKPASECTRDDIPWVKGFAAVVVYTCVKRDYYSLCFGHRIRDPQQGAHECLSGSYRDRVIRHICSMLDPYKMFKLLRVVHGLSPVNSFVKPNMLKILRATVKEIRYATDPCAKLRSMPCTMCCDKKMAQRLIERRVCNLYLNNRQVVSVAPQRLFYNR